MEKPADLGEQIDINSLTPNTSYYFFSQTTPTLRPNGVNNDGNPKYKAVGDFRYNKIEFHHKDGDNVYITQRVIGEEPEVNLAIFIKPKTNVYKIKPKGTYGGKRTRKTKHRKSCRRSSRRRN
jgi:hypothetical protein